MEFRGRIRTKSGGGGASQPTSKKTRAGDGREEGRRRKEEEGGGRRTKEGRRRREDEDSGKQLRGEYVQDGLRGGGGKGMPNKDAEQIIYVPPLKCDIHMSKCYFPKDNLRLNEM